MVDHIRVSSKRNILAGQARKGSSQIIAGCAREEMRPQPDKQRATKLFSNTINKLYHHNYCERLPKSSMRWSSQRQKQSRACRRKGMIVQVTIFVLLISLVETSGQVSHSCRRDRLVSPLVESWPRGWSSALASRSRMLQETLPEQQQSQEPTSNRREECSLTNECRTCTTNDKDTIDECQKTGKIIVFTCQVYDEQENQGTSEIDLVDHWKGINQLTSF